MPTPTTQSPEPQTGTRHRATGQNASAASQTPSRPSGAGRAAGVSLLWRVFAVNATVFIVAVALLAWTPVTVHRVATPGELLVLFVGLAAMLAVDLVLLRRTLGPLRRLAAVMTAVDPAQPGRRADPPPAAGREVVALAEALNAMLDRLEGERRESARRALAATEAERARIARELHDEVGQTLTAIALRAERAAAQEGSPALAEIAEHAERSLDDVRRISRELRPEALDDLGLVKALSALCSRVDGQGGVRIDRQLAWEIPPLGDEVELVVYRVAQEALTNVLRHAEATHATVSLVAEPCALVLTVRDDGRGVGTPERRGGLEGMRERAMLVGADLCVRGAAPAGTEVVLRVPIAE